MSLSGINGMIELVGGVLIVLGLFTRPVAFILAGDMTVAYFIARAPRGFGTFRKIRALERRDAFLASFTRDQCRLTCNRQALTAACGLNKEYLSEFQFR